MGIFDTVTVPCPGADCDATIEFQSKHGDAGLLHFAVDDVPTPAALDLDGFVLQCDGCGRKVRLSTDAPPRVAMQVEVADDDTPTSY